MNKPLTGATLRAPARVDGFILDARALAIAKASSVLAIDPRAIGSSHQLDGLPATQRTEMVGTTAVLPIFGPLTQRAEAFMCGFSDGYDSIVQRFVAALEDPSVAALVLKIDSPGGDAAGNSESVRQMLAAKKKAGKPVYAYADELAASAAYALATVGDAIFLPPSGVVGSVGCIAVHFDQSKQLESDGVAVTVFRSGARKAQGTSVEPLTEDSAASIQSQVNELAGQFAALVAKARGMSTSDVLALEGAVFMGKAAVEAGLADGLMSFGDVLRRAESDGRAAAGRRKMKSIAIKLGLREDATETEVLAEMDRLQGLVTATGKATASEAIGSIEAWKADSAKLADERKSKAEVEKKLERNEALHLIDVAYQARKLTPASKPKAVEFYEKHGREALQSFLDALTPLAASVEHAEAKSVTGNASDAPSTDSGDGVTRRDGKPFEALSFDALHNLRATDANAYAALHANWVERGRPRRAS